MKSDERLCTKYYDYKKQVIFSLGSSDSTYNDLFKANNLLDVKPHSLVPTWRNGRSGLEAISKRLDRFLVAEAFLTSSIYPTSWVEFPFVSDHAPIVLKLMPPALHRATPFKFNYHWLLSEEYTDMVHRVWTNDCYLAEVDPQRRLVWKLKALKSKTKAWYSDKLKAERALLSHLEAEISELIGTSSTTSLSAVEVERLKSLELNRATILRDEERAWRLRSRATWLKLGDSNTKFFHHVASYNRCKKNIWSINCAGNEPIRGQEAILAAAEEHFKHQFTPSNEQFLSEKISTASLFPKFITQESAEL